MRSHRIRAIALTALVVALLGGWGLRGPARASAGDGYLNFLVGQLRHDPVYISSYASTAAPGQAPAIARLVAGLPEKTYVIADVAAGPDGKLPDSDLAAVLHDQLGGGIFILARLGADDASATGFGTSLPVSDAMSAATFELSYTANLVQLITRFKSILLSGKTEQRLSADEAAIERGEHGSQTPAWEVPTALGAGAVTGGGLTALLVRRRRRGRPGRPVTA